MGHFSYIRHDNGNHIVMPSVVIKPCYNNSMKRALPFLTSAIAIAAIMTTLSYFISDASQAKSTLTSGLIAAIVIAAIPIYDIDTWKLPKKTVLHFLLMTATVLPLLFYAEWFSIMTSIIVFILFGCVAWVIGYLANRLSIEKDRQV